MTYLDHGHPIIMIPYKLIKNEDIDLKLLGYDHWGTLTLFIPPTFTWSNLTSHSHDLTGPWSQIFINQPKIKILT